LDCSWLSDLGSWLVASKRVGSFLSLLYRNDAAGEYRWTMTRVYDVNAYPQVIYVVCNIAETQMRSITRSSKVLLHATFGYGHRVETAHLGSWHRIRFTR